MNTLNSFLLERAPKDPQPSRRSQRKSTDEGMDAKHDEGLLKRKCQGNSGQLATTSDAVSRASLSQAEHLMESKDEESPQGEKSPTNTKRKRELNVGGWISPNFAASLDRSWVNKDVAHKNIDPKSFVPQPGDTVL